MPGWRRAGAHARWLTDAKQPHFDEFLAAWARARESVARGECRVENGVVADLTHEAEGVVRGS
jgi:hypothetical protein